MNQLTPTKGDLIKTKSGTKVWRVRRISDEEIILEGVTPPFKFKRLNSEQYQKTWRQV